MIGNRELVVEDYVAILRRRLSLILLLPLPCALVGLLVSFFFTPKYTSRSLLLVEPQMVPAGYVKPIITARVSDRLASLQQNVLSRTRLQSLINRLGLVREGKDGDEVIESVRANVRITEADASAPPGSLGFNRGQRPGIDDVTGFYVSFSADNPRDAQQVCAEITSSLLEENLQDRQQAAQSTTDFLSRELEQAKLNLDTLDQKLSEFKKLHLGQLPGDEDRNLKILAGLSSQLDATTQELTRAEQDKAFAESVLSQQVAALDSYRAAPNLPPLRQKLVSLENQLVELRSRYTEEHPEVVKVENDISEIRSRLKEDLGSEEEDSLDDKAPKVDPPPVLRLREQIHRDTGVIERATQNQKRLQQLVDTYQARLSLSPDVEEQYKQLTRDNTTAHAIYDNLLANRSSAEMQTEMERKQQGEQVKLIDPASLPTRPSFPVRWKFATSGLAAGLALGLAIGFWQEIQDKGLRNEADVVSALEMPLLVSLPWVGLEKEPKTNLVHRISRSSGGTRTAAG